MATDGPLVFCIETQCMGWKWNSCLLPVRLHRARAGGMLRQLYRMCRLRAGSLTEAQVKLEMGQHQGRGQGQHVVRESGVPLLAAQKPVKRPGWWKSLLYFRYWQVEGQGEWMSVQKPTPSPPPPPHWQSEARVFIDRERGLYAESAQSALTVSLKLVIRGWPASSLIWVQLIFSSRVGLFAFLWGQFLELGQLTSCG